MPSIKYKKTFHSIILLLLLFCLISIVRFYPACIEVFAQDSIPGESSSKALKSKTESSTDTDKKNILESEDVNGQNLEIHEFVRDQDNCNKCHDVRQTADNKASVIVFVDNSAIVQTVNCMKCHPQHFGDHPVLVQTFIPVPKDLPLSKNMEITCMTCHNTHYLRYSDRPWTPRSHKNKFLDFVKKKKEYKTYFLRRNNSEKELCISCHTAVRHQKGY